MKKSNTATAAPINLPPDPQRLNRQRSLWAENALAAHEKRSGSSGGKMENLVALLCNLNHWADRNNLDMGDALEQAALDYERETRE